MHAKVVKKLFSHGAACRRVLELIRTLARELDAKGFGKIKIMNFCGTHEWVVTHYGIRSVMPSNVELVAGPGCPVCITPSYVVRYAIDLAMEGVTVMTFGDMARVPVEGSPSSLIEARAMGGRVEIVYSFVDALERVRKERSETVFLAIGFETTAPSYSIPIERRVVPKNLYLLTALRLTPPVMRYVLQLHGSRETPISGVVAPGHVSTVIGWRAWEFLPREFGVPTVVAGFEPLDVLMAIAHILRMLLEGVPKVVNEYRRSVREDGSRVAKESMDRVFRVCDAVWRGIGLVPMSGLDLSKDYAEWDAYERFGLERVPRESVRHDHPPGCICDKVILGLAKPTQCPHFMKRCTPSHPLGPCMVSAEGTCRIWAQSPSLATLSVDRYDHG